MIKKLKYKIFSCALIIISYSKMADVPQSDYLQCLYCGKYTTCTSWCSLSQAICKTTGGENQCPPTPPSPCTKKPKPKKKVKAVKKDS